MFVVQPLATPGLLNTNTENRNYRREEEKRRKRKTIIRKFRPKKSIQKMKNTDKNKRKNPEYRRH